MSHDPTMLLEGICIEPSESLQDLQPSGVPESSATVPNMAESNDIVDFAVASLEWLQPSLTRCIVGALQPQLKELRRDLQQLRALQTADRFPAVAASSLASAVGEALRPQFELLERRTAAASTAKSASLPAADAREHVQSPLVASELLQQMKGPLGDAIDHILDTRIKLPITSIARKEVQLPEVDVSPQQTAPLTPTLTLPLSPRRIPPESIVGQVERHSSLLRNAQPSKAFVVNFRRLVQVQKILSLIHLIIKSTAIATLTLVSSAYWTDLFCSITFVGFLLALYAIHEIRHDSMDIADYKSLGNLLEDDVGWRNGHVIENPNRLLKALSVSSNHRRRFRSLLTIAIAVLIIVLTWLSVFWSWSSPPEGDAHWLGLFNEHDVEVQATQLLIGTVMVWFHAVFELLYWRETQCVMPWDVERNMPWDPREKHGRGLHFSHRWFGLPSMWFTSREAYDDLRLWITLSRSKRESSHVVTKIFPEEMALFALDPDNACDLRQTLKHAKLFSSKDWHFLVRGADGDADMPACTISGRPGRKPYRPIKVGEEPEELGIELALFDSATGQFLEPHPHAEYRSSLMQLVKTPR